MIMNILLVWALLTLFVLPTLTHGQKLHDYPTYKSSSQNILVIGETGSGKSTFVQYMLVKNIANLNHSKINASVNSVTKMAEDLTADTMILDTGHVAATYYDTVGFNAEDIDSTKVFADLHAKVKHLENIHKVLIVHRVGRARDAVVKETKRTIELLKDLGATKRNVYVTLTFAFDYNRQIRNRMLNEVAQLYGDNVDRKNIFYSHYVLLLEIEEDVQRHYLDRILLTHKKVLHKVLEPVLPFQPVVAAIKKLESSAARGDYIMYGLAFCGALAIVGAIIEAVAEKIRGKNK